MPEPADSHCSTIIDLLSLELFISSNKTSGSNGQTNHELNFLW